MLRNPSCSSTYYIGVETRDQLVGLAKADQQKQRSYSNVSMANYPQSVQGGRSLRLCVLSALWESSRVYGYGGRRHLYSQRPRRPCLVKKRSTDLLHDPWYNKVVSFISRAFQKHSNESLIMSLGLVESLSIHSV